MRRRRKSDRSGSEGLGQLVRREDPGGPESFEPVASAVSERLSVNSEEDVAARMEVGFVDQRITHLAALPARQR